MAWRVVPRRGGVATLCAAALLVPARAATAPEAPSLSAVAAARGDVIAALAAALRAGKKIPPAPEPRLLARDYAGRDGELLRLQDEVLSLELETLARAR